MGPPTSTPARLRAFGRALLLLVGVCVPLSVAHAAGDAAGAQSEARAYFDKATASFALGHYPVAAENFEKAFELKPDPALLYNAAQAHRLAGNKERAVALYQNYLRLYPKAVRRSEVETHVQELKKAIERDRQLATSPPITTMPSTIPPGPPPAAPTTSSPASPPTPPPVVVASAPRIVSDASASRALPQAVDTKPAAPVLVARPEPANTEKRSLLQKPLFWSVVGGAVAAAVVVVLIVALGGPKDPSPSLGTVK